MVVRKYEDELKFIEKITDNSWRIKKGFQVSKQNFQFAQNLPAYKQI